MQACYRKSVCRDGGREMCRVGGKVASSIPLEAGWYRWARKPFLMLGTRTRATDPSVMLDLEQDFLGKGLGVMT